MTTAILNAWADPATGNITTFERVRSGAVVKRLVRGEHVSYLLTADVPADVLRSLRKSSNVAGVTSEGVWTRVVWRTRQAREAACDPEHGWFAKQKIATYEADVPTVRRWMIDNAIAIQRPRRVYLDIETCGRFPIAEKEKTRVLCWTLAKAGPDGEPVLVAQGVLERDDDADEKRLLQQLWGALEAFDQVLAWNGDSFDFPVIVARSATLGIRFDMRRWLWLDHLELFRRMNLNSSESGDEKQSMALDAVAKSVLKTGKTEGISHKEIFPWWAAGGEKRKRVLAYNENDVFLMIRIEEKTGYVELLHTLCEVTGVVADTRGIQPMPQVESFMFRLAKERGVHFKTRKRSFDESGAEQFKGAFVMEPTARGIARDVHVADFSAMYPSIILSFNLSPETLVPADPDAWLNTFAALPGAKKGEDPVPAGCARAPITGAVFRQDPRGILPIALDHLLQMRKFWSDKQASLPPGTPEWVDAGRRSTAYKITANSFFGVSGARVSRLYDHDVAESTTQIGVWLIKQTIAAAQSAPWNLTVIYGDTDSIFVVGCTVERFRKFVAWCNGELYPRLLREQGCTENRVKIAYEKAFDRLVFTSAKHYAGRYAHYKGKLPTKDSKPEIKGLEYKRGDAMKLARYLQAQVIDLMMGGGVEVPAAFGEEASRLDRRDECEDSAAVFIELVTKVRDRVLTGEMFLADVVLSKRLSKPLKEYAIKAKKDGTDGAQPPHVRVAREIEKRGGDVRAGTRIEYLVIDGATKPATIIPAADWTGECDRFDLWESYIWPPTERLLQAAFPAESWKHFGRVRLRTRHSRALAPRGGALAVVPAQGAPPAPAAPFSAPTAQGALFSLGDLAPAPFAKRRKSR